MKTKMSRKLLSLVMVFAMVLSLCSVSFAAQSGVTRGELAALMVKEAGLEDQVAAYAARTSAFQDVAEGSQYEGYINLAYDKGLVSGTGAGKFSPNAVATQVEAAALLLKNAGIAPALMKSWPADYNEMARWSGLTDGVNYTGGKALTEADFAAMAANCGAVAAKPVIGISWAYYGQEEEYASYKTVIKAAGGIPVELAKMTSTSVAYDSEGMIEDSYLEDTGMLKQQYADVVKSKDFSKSNITGEMTGIDGVFFTGGEDISPSLFATPVPVDNEGEEINATRDISDYTLMAYCIEKDIPTFAVCRGQQMMSIVSGSTFIQDLPNYFAAQKAEYHHEHRMPPGTPNRDYERHDVDIFKDKSKWMYDIVGSTELKNVSSWHHQAAGSVEGTNLTVVASTTVSGVEIIEAVERQDKTFCLGVQFHPENDLGLALYENKPEEALCDVDTCMGFFETLVAYASGKPVVGISWKANDQNYAAFKTVIKAAGGIPVEMPKVTSTAVTYNADGMIADSCLEKTGNLKQQYADVVKSKDFTKSNVADAVAFKGIDAMFFTGGEDVSPSLFATPVPEANEGEEINATRDISDYTLMAYCIENDIPTFAVCRGEQVMSIVSGCEFIQDIPNYYKEQNAAYPDTHRMPVGAPNRTYARHDVEILDGSKWLENIVGAKELKNVSSWHHQAVGSVEGTNLTVVAKTTVNGIDIVEAVERQDKTFCLGVQFHPENDCKLALYDNKPEAALCDLDTCMRFFETLVDYASK